MKVATFNVNSIRNRLEVILRWMQDNKADMLCLQETKCQDKDFPEDAIKEAGLNCAFCGQKTFNGVALVSPHELTDVSTGAESPVTGKEARFISARVGDVLFVNTYIPMGQEKGTDKFEFKLEFLDYMRDYFAGLLRTENIVWCGDFNIALTDMDLYEPDAHRGGVCFCEEEQTRLRSIMELGLSDTYRQLWPDAEKAFTFWDYRIPAAVRRGMGWRLDYIMASQAVADTLTASWIDKEVRMQPKPSDHTLLISEFNYNL